QYLDLSSHRRSFEEMMGSKRSMVTVHHSCNALSSSYQDRSVSTTEARRTASLRRSETGSSPRNSSTPRRIVNARLGVGFESRALTRTLSRKSSRLATPVVLFGARPVVISTCSSASESTLGGVALARE